MKVIARVELPQEITKDSIVKQLLEDKKKLEGKVGRAEQRVKKLELILADGKEENEDARKFLDVVVEAAKVHLKLNEDDYCF